MVNTRSRKAAHTVAPNENQLQQHPISPVNGSMNGEGRGVLATAPHENGGLSVSTGQANASSCYSNGEDVDGQSVAIKEEDSPGADNNMFRSNIEFTEEPRQIVSLVLMVCVVGWAGYRRDDSNSDSNVRAAAAALCFLLMVHCFLQCRDTLLVRPHPGVWRLVHGLGLTYLFGITALLFNSRSDARRLMSIVFTDMSDYPITAPETGDGAVQEIDCSISPEAVYRQLTEVWFVAHVLGWWGKMCLFRDWHICWVLSIGFEVLELSMGWLVPQFKECWWDALIIDLLGANLIGMLLGLLTLRFLESKGYDWKGADNKPGTPSGRKSSQILRRARQQFSPFTWRKWQWGTFTSFKRFCQIAVLVMIVLATELNAFMMLNALDVPKGCSYNVARLAMLFLVGLPAANEYYEYITNPHCYRLGQNSWLVLAILHVEVIAWVKFLPQSIIELPSPSPEVRIPWLATLSMLTLWCLLFYITHKNKRPTTPHSRTHAHEHEVHDTPTIKTSRSLSAASDASSVTTTGGELRRRLSWSSGSGAGGKKTSRVLLDVLFAVSFLPLVYLAKQWYS